MWQDADLIIRKETAFPEYGHAFADGPSSIYVNCGGELCFLSYIAGPFDLLGWPVHFFPLWRRDVDTVEGGAVYSPFIRFQSRRQGTAGHPFFWAGDSDMYPFGYRCQHPDPAESLRMDAVLDENSFTCVLSDAHPERALLRVYLETKGFVQGDIHKKSGGYGVDMRLGPPELLNDRDRHAVIVRWAVEYRDRRYPLCLALAGRADFSLSQAGTTWMLDFDWCRSGESTAPFFLVFGTAEAEVFRKLEACRANPNLAFRKQAERSSRMQSRIASLSSPDQPALAGLFNSIPLCVDSFKAPGVVEGGIGLRGSRLKYGIFNGTWDQTLSQRTFALAGDHAASRACLVNAAPIIEAADKGNPPYLGWRWFYGTSLLAYADVSGDSELVDLEYPRLRRFVDQGLARADANGFIPDRTCGVDFMDEVGGMRQGVPVLETGVFYELLCRLANLAWRRGDREYAALLNDTAGRLRTAFLPAFFDDKAGFLSDAVAPASGMRTNCHPYYATFTYTGLYGDSLLWPVSDRLADFVVRELTHPAGRFQFAPWDDVAEMWHACCMHQHESGLNKMLRHAGRTDELLRSLRFFTTHFNRDGVVHETHNLTPTKYDYLQYADWQNFSPWAWYATILESFLGIEPDRAGLTWLPGDFPHDLSLTGFKLGASTWDITVTGAGAVCAGLRIDDRDYPGLLKTPWRLHEAGRHSLAVQRVADRPEHPLLLAAPDAGIEYVGCGHGRLELTLHGGGWTPLKLWAPREPVVRVDGEPLPVAWEAARGIARAWAPYRDGAALAVEAAKE